MLQKDRIKVWDRQLRRRSSSIALTKSEEQGTKSILQNRRFSSNEKRNSDSELSRGIPEVINTNER